jgi:hypothetical protein
MAEVDNEQAKAHQLDPVVGQTGPGAETLDYLQRVSMEAAVARIEAAVARTEANLVHLDRGVSETPADVKDVRDRLARLEANVARLPGRGFILFAVMIAVAVVAILILFQTNWTAFLSQRP